MNVHNVLRVGSHKWIEQANITTRTTLKVKGVARLHYRIQMSTIIIISNYGENRTETNQVAGCSLQVTASHTSVKPVVSDHQQWTYRLWFWPGTLRRSSTITMTTCIITCWHHRQTVITIHKFYQSTTSITGFRMILWTFDFTFFLLIVR